MSASTLLQGHLRPRLVARPVDVELDAYRSEGRRLVLLTDAGLIEPVGHYIFYKVCEHRGLLERTSTPLDVFVTDGAAWASTAADWAAKGFSVDLVVVRPLPLHVATALVLVAAGQGPAQAIAEVERALPSFEFDLDAEVAVSAFRYRLHAHLLWKEARRIARRGVLQ